MSLPLFGSLSLDACLSCFGFLSPFGFPLCLSLPLSSSLVIANSAYPYILPHSKHPCSTILPNLNNYFGLSHTRPLIFTILHETTIKTVVDSFLFFPRSIHEPLVSLFAIIKTPEPRFSTFGASYLFRARFLVLVFSSSPTFVYSYTPGWTGSDYWC